MFYPLLIDEFEPFMNHQRKTYDGQIASWAKSKNRTKIPKAVLVGAYTYENIKSRTSRTSKYPTYKGLSCDFSKREFIYWWIVQNRFYKMKKPSVGRINHFRGYSFDNIKLEELSENSRESRYRTGTHVKPMGMIISKNRIDVAETISATQAARYIGVSVNMPIAVANGEHKQSKGWNFRWKQQA